MISDKINLCDLPYAELERFAVAELGFKKFRAGQIWQWIWAKNVSSFDAMTDLSQADRAKLDEKAIIRWPAIADVRVSSDGTTKFLLELADGELIETVLIPSDAPKRPGDITVRMTQCISTQVGCAMACSFCSTGKLGFKFAYPCYLRAVFLQQAGAAGCGILDSLLQNLNHLSGILGRMLGGFPRRLGLPALRLCLAKSFF